VRQFCEVMRRLVIPGAFSCRGDKIVPRFDWTFWDSLGMLEVVIVLFKHIAVIHSFFNLKIGDTLMDNGKRTPPPHTENVTRVPSPVNDSTHKKCVLKYEETLRDYCDPNKYIPRLKGGIDQSTEQAYFISFYNEYIQANVSGEEAVNRAKFRLNTVQDHLKSTWSNWTLDEALTSAKQETAKVVAERETLDTLRSNGDSRVTHVLSCAASYEISLRNTGYSTEASSVREMQNWYRLFTGQAPLAGAYRNHCKLDLFEDFLAFKIPDTRDRTLGPHRQALETALDTLTEAIRGQEFMRVDHLFER
jgi:hypothetical protein